MRSNKKTGRIAGFLFLTVIICGVFAEFFVRQKIFVSDNPTATVHNISINEWLFRIGIISDIAMIVAFFFFSLVLYQIFKHINKNHARLMLLSVMIAVSILLIIVLYQIAALLLVTGSDYVNGFETSQLNGLVIFFLKMHTNGYFISQVFYGLYLFPLGYMIFKSGLAPKIIGILLMLGCIGDQIDVIRFFLLPDYESVVLQNITVPADLGELSLCLWLLIKGVKEQNDV
ncbi:DUF4386 domain-containing protein [Aquimarina longa]|uniref:DUF4386 domain-containing protein n=1 Tax=Aquimarina longa TaxID=1080221 RepID=UPI00078096EA|nr:DUF4386 domain-containing protein [Aquimarina longa]